MTPPELIEELGPFDLDPCAPIVRPWDTAKAHYDINQNGLILPWYGFVWMNPPYGTKNTIWMERLAKHGNGIALTFARTETEMFSRCIWSEASALFFIHGRLHFHYIDGTRAKANSGAPSVLVAYGDRAHRTLAMCQLNGVFINNWSYRK